MELSVELADARAVKDLIARGVLLQGAAASVPASAAWQAFSGHLGPVQLHPHQISAIERLRSAIDEFGGALLSDEVGMGKTFVALAIARRFTCPVVVAPAVLRDMWAQQAENANSQLPFISFESLSRGFCPARKFDLIIVDEAQHVRNPGTRRYRSLSRLALRSAVLMLSATPIHNKRRDLTAQLSIFLGSRAGALSPSEVARCVVRRQIEGANLSLRIPETGALVWKDLHDDSSLPTALLSLPPPLPPRDGGDAGVLIVRSLLRQWCSSDAAFYAAVRRRLARSIALMSALESGHYPSKNELSAWTVADDSVQLAFPSFVATSLDDTAELLETVRVHHRAVQALFRSLDTSKPRDVERARVLEEIRRHHQNVPIVAFSQYSETVIALFRELRSSREIAVLTGEGAWVAGGPITRQEAIERFAPHASGVAPAREAERITLLLATDLLSEGVNLQDAAVVVHLDLPWTPARLEQRMGRVARLGSIHRHVHSYGIRPPIAAELLIRLEATIRSKIRDAEAAIGTFRPLLPGGPGKRPGDEPSVSQTKQRDPLTATENTRAVLESWRADPIGRFGLALPLTAKLPRVAAVASDVEGFIALCTFDDRLEVLASTGMRVTNEPAEIEDVLSRVGKREARPNAALIAHALELLHTRFRSTLVAGLTEPESAFIARARRTALHRVSSILQRARPHMRPRLLELGATAREVVLGRLGAAAEAEIMRMASLPLADEQWLTSIASFAEGTMQAEPRGKPANARTVSAILLLQP